MSSGLNADQSVVTNSDIDRIIRLLHRRRGWAWVGFGSVIGLIGYLILGIELFTSITGPAVLATVVPVFLLVILAVAGLIAALVDTIRLHHFDKAAREAARPRVVHHPVHAHVHRRPRKHFPTWIAALVMLMFQTAVMVTFLPWEVNNVAYLVGAERPDTFHAVQYTQYCYKGCRTETAGYVSSSGEHLTLDRVVPLGSTVSVRDPFWDWGAGHSFVSGTGSAIAAFIVWLVLTPFALFFFWALASIVWDAWRKLGNKFQPHKTSP